ncbi:MAG: MmcQ/YjbR family DNA-binding protein [Flavobacteriales bacterium]|nr:MmcQ/YjbR family DNA-binding protein [Flavobacteriales bacterium]
MDSQHLRAVALDMPGTAVKEHFGRPSYSVKKKIYLTVWDEEQRAVLKLTPAQQADFMEAHPDAFAAVPQKLGKYGWTSVFLAHVNVRLFRYAMDLAWRNVAPKWLILTRPFPPRP